MQKTRAIIGRGITWAAAVFVLAGILRVPERFGPPLVNAALFLTINLIYIGLAIVWGVSIKQRLQQRCARRFLLTVCSLLVFWILLRACKYKYFDPLDAALRYLWYGYYIPQLFGPVFGLLAALCLGRSETYRPSRKHYLLFIPAAALCALIMTNDLHQLAFRFQPGFRDWTGTYTHGVVYYMAMIWLVGLLITSFCILQAKCKSAGVKRYSAVPAFLFLFGFGLCLLSFAGVFWIYQLPELFCATYAATWEACIGVGLVPSNKNYIGFFSVSTIAATITDAGGQAQYIAKGAETLSMEEMKHAQESPVMLDANVRLHALPIRGGYVYWQSHVEAVNRMNDELAEKRALLTEEVEIARAESEIHAQKARIEEQNRVYDRISVIAQPQLAKLDTLLAARQPDDAEYRHVLKTACILGAYIKRRLNLQLIAENASKIHVNELYFCLRESAEYLSAGGVLCKCVPAGDGVISSDAALLAYDFFQAVIEAALPTLSSLLIRCGMRDGHMELRLVLEDAANSVEPGWRKEALIAWNGSFERQLTDGTLFYTLHIEEGDAA